jgi:hypothetical protein
MKINTKPFEELISYLSTPPVEIFAFNDNVIPALKELIKLAEAVNSMFPVEEPELFNCPFCGEKPSISISEIDYGEHWVSCKNNFCEIQPSTNGHMEKQYAIEKWNARK